MYFFCANRSENKIYLTLGVHAGTSNRTSKASLKENADAAFGTGPGGALRKAAAAAGGD